MTCPYLDYREESDDQSFETPRAYCTAADRFVQPMRADICNDRYDLDHAADCEIYRAHERAEAEQTEAERAAETDSEDGDDV